MKFARQMHSDGSQIVDASGAPLGSSDVDRPVLHVLPKLFVPREMVLSGTSRRCLVPEDVTLTVNSSLPVQILPEGGVAIRQPYPNQRYFVAGSNLIRNGWIVPIPLDVTKFDIEFEWNLESSVIWPPAATQSAPLMATQTAPPGWG